MVNTNLLKAVRFTNLNKWSANYALFTKIESAYPLVPLSSVLKRIKNSVVIEDEALYKRITVRLYGQGVLKRDELYGIEIGTKKQFIAQTGQLIISRIDARNGAFGIVPEELSGAIVTNDFWLFDVQNALPQYLTLILSSERFQKYWRTQSSGTTNRQRVCEEDFLNAKIVLPPLIIQEELLEKYNDLKNKARILERKALKLEENLEQEVYDSLGIQAKDDGISKPLLSTVRLQDIQQWGYDKIAIRFPYAFEKYEAYSFASHPSWLKEIYRGKSPVYCKQEDFIILNQRCNRKNEIDLRYAKNVSETWLNKVPKSVLTKKNDILINSTGEGTLGRASLITSDEHVGLAYDSHMLLLRVNQNEIDPLLFVYLFNSPFGQKQVDLYKSAQATKQTELGIENTKKMLFPLPPLPIQKNISNVIAKGTLQIVELREEAKELYQKAKIDFEDVIFGEAKAVVSQTI